MQGKLSLGVIAVTRSAGERARNTSADTSGITAAAGGMVTASKDDGEGERCRLGVQASARQITMTSPMRTELCPAGNVGGAGVTVVGVVYWCPGPEGPVEHSHGRMTESTGGRGCTANGLERTRLLVWFVCTLVCWACLFCELDASASQKAAALEVALLARAAKESVRTPGSVVSHRFLQTPDGASGRPVRVQVTVRSAAGVFGSHVFCFSGVGGKMNETSTRSTLTGGGASCWRGGCFPRCQLESSTCRDPKSTSPVDRTTALDD